MKIVLREEVKYIYGGPNRIRGEWSSQNLCLRWQETFPSPQYNILKVFHDRRMGKYWIKDKDEG